MYCLFPHTLLQHQLSSFVQYNLSSLSHTHTPLSPFNIPISHLFLHLFSIIHSFKSLIPHSHFFPSHILQLLYNFSLTQNSFFNTLPLTHPSQTFSQFSLNYSTSILILSFYTLSSNNY